MDDDCTCCVAARFLNPAGQAVSGVHWVNKDLLDHKEIRILVKNGDDEEFRNYSILKISSSLIGSFLVNDIRIGPHDNRPKTVTEVLQAWWIRSQPLRHSFPILSILVGLLVALTVLLLGVRALNALGILEYPMASMVWLWSYFGSHLGNVVVVLTLAFAGLRVAEKQYVFAGFAFGIGFGLAILANNVSETIVREIPLDASWPSSYIFLGDELKLVAMESMKGWGDWLDPIWPAITVLLNALGLTVAADLVNKLLPFLTGLKVEPAAEKVQPAVRKITDHRPPIGGARVKTLSQDEPTLVDVLKGRRPNVDDEPFIDADLKALDPVPLEVPEKPFFC